jgi:hypothetical protein
VNLLFSGMLSVVGISPEKQKGKNEKKECEEALRSKKWIKVQ